MIKTNFLHLSIWSSVLMIFFSSMSSASEENSRLRAQLFYDSFAADTEELQEITWEDLETFSAF